MYFSKAFKQIEPLVFDFAIYSYRKIRFFFWGGGVYLKVNILILKCLKHGGFFLQNIVQYVCKNFYRINFDIVRILSRYFWLGYLYRFGLKKTCFWLTAWKQRGITQKESISESYFYYILVKSLNKRHEIDIKTLSKTFKMNSRPL